MPRTVTFPDVEPSDTDMESNVLGSILMGGAKTLDICATEIRLGPEHFYRESNAAIYRAMLEVAEKGGGVDSESVRIQLEQTAGVLNDQDMRAHLEIHLTSVPALGDFRRYAARVVELAEWRARLRASYEQIEAIARLDLQAYRDATATDLLVGAAHEGLLTPDDLGSEWFDWYQAPNDDDTIPTPWREITEGLYGGFRPGDSTVITGHPGMGKSTGGDQMLEHAKVTRGLACCAYVNEMSTIDRTSRMLAARAGVSFKKIMRRELNPDEARRTLKAASDLPFAMQPCAGWSVDAICRHLRHYRWGMAFLDLATRIPARDTADWDRISGALADAARQSGTHLLLSVQLNRERNTGAARPMPVLRDLRNTGAWEADHRNVLIFHRREEVDKDTGIPVTYDDGVIHLAKVSNGQKDAAARVYLDYGRMQFKPLAGSNHPLNENRMTTATGEDLF